MYTLDTRKINVPFFRGGGGLLGLLKFDFPWPRSSTSMERGVTPMTDDEIMAMYIEIKDVNAPFRVPMGYSSSQTPLTYALDHKHRDAVYYLIRRGARVYDGDRRDLIDGYYESWTWQTYFDTGVLKHLDSGWWTRYNNVHYLDHLLSRRPSLDTPLAHLAQDEQDVRFLLQRGSFSLGIPNAFGSEFLTLSEWGSKQLYVPMDWYHERWSDAVDRIKNEIKTSVFLQVQCVVPVKSLVLIVLDYCLMF